MNKLLYVTLIFPFIFFHLFTSLATKSIKEDNNYEPELMKLKKEKLTQMRFYWHDIAEGQNQTSILSVPSPNNTSATLFGEIRVMDDPLTVEPNRSSKLIGRSRGIYASTSLKEFDFLMVMNFVFTEGEYNGSSITIAGWNPTMANVREMPILGGTGLFRFSRGYVKASTYYFIYPVAIVKYDAYVLHY